MTANTLFEHLSSLSLEARPWSKPLENPLSIAFLVILKLSVCFTLTRLRGGYKPDFAAMPSDYFPNPSHQNASIPVLLYTSAYDQRTLQLLTQLNEQASIDSSS